MPFENSSATWKIDRAKELLDGLDKEVFAWQETNPYGFYTYISPNFRRASVIVEVRNEPPIIRWSLIIADIIHNLRCALDHTLWAILLNEFSSVIPRKAEKISFPIWDAPPTPDQRRAFERIGPKLLAAIESVQWYNNPLSSDPVQPLAIIRDIDNANKHKLLFTAMASVAKIEVKATGLRKDYQDLSISEVYRGELKDGVEAVVTTFDVPHPYLKYECPLFISIIAIRHPIANRLGQDRDDYAALIDRLVVEVRKTIDALVQAAV
jgi:hypothetical protein